VRICAERVRMHPKGGHHSFIATQSVAFALVEGTSVMYRRYITKSGRIKKCKACFYSERTRHAHRACRATTGCDSTRKSTVCSKSIPAALGTLSLRERVPRAGHQTHIKSIGP
jgi:hypothetical protein